MTELTYLFAVVFAVALGVVIGERLPLEGAILYGCLVCFGAGASVASGVWFILTRRQQQTQPEPLVMIFMPRQEAPDVRYLEGRHG